MKQKFLSVLILLTPSLVHAQVDATEQALILNQELQFLEESASAAKIPLPGSRAENLARRGDNKDQSLESTYFGDSEEDSVGTRTAAPRRRAP